MNPAAVVKNPDGRECPVYVGENILAAQLARFCKDAPVVALAADDIVMPMHGEKLADELRAAGVNVHAALMKSGEEHKTLDAAAALCDAFLEMELARDGAVIALGGGVTGDVAGFAAAMHMRGVPLLQAPSTLLAQTDAAIGGKTGVNRPAGKNLVGAFHPPRAVVCELTLLATLPPREFRAGLAEVVKHGVLGDAALFEFLERNAENIIARDFGVLSEMLARSIKVKADIVNADERESGARALLNLGHTFAHALEAALGYGKWTHGEAVAAGLVAAGKLALRGGEFSAAELARLAALLEKFGLPTTMPKEAGADELLDAMRADKKKRGGAVLFILPTRIGCAVQRQEETPAEEVRAVIKEMQATG